MLKMFCAKAISYYAYMLIMLFIMLKMLCAEAISFFIFFLFFFIIVCEIALLFTILQKSVRGKKLEQQNL